MTMKSVHLPGELITEILMRLPVKSVLCCKCVCKSWLSLISDPHFASLHIQLAASPTHKLLSINYDDPKKALSIDFNASPYNDSAFVSLRLDFFRPGYRLEIGGSCRGFLFLRRYRDFYIWNPSTGVHKQIPVSNSNKYTVKLLHGFGYDMSCDDYMVVLGSIKYNYRRKTSSIDLEIFSLRANKWKQVEAASDLPYRKTANSEVGPTVGSFLNDSIHWLVYNYETKSNVIIAFDLKEKTLSEIALPDDFSRGIYVYDLMVFGGLISVWNIEWSKIKIWVMQEYKVHSSWSKTLEFSFSPGLGFSPICFTSCGDIVGPDAAAAGLAKLNDKGQLLEYHSYGDSYYKRSQTTVYIESLLSLPDGAEQA